MRWRPSSRLVRPTAQPLYVTALLATFVSVSFSDPTHPRGEAPADLVPETRGRVPLFVETADGASLATRVEELGGVVQHVFGNIDGISVLLPSGAVRELETDPRVTSVRRQRFVREAVAEPGFLEQFRKKGMSGRSSRVSSAGATSSVRIPGARFLPIDPHDLASGTRSGETSFLGYDLITGAADAWEATGYGEGTLVAVIDTGIFSAHPLIEGNVVGGINLVPAEEEQAIDVDGDGAGDGFAFGWYAIENDGHGTFVSGLIAGHADLEVPADDPFTQSVAFHSPESVDFDGDVARIHLMGAAPAASLYAVKVFPFRGGAAPDARVGEAIDALITAKKNGELDVDVINMSLSGPVLDDGRYFLDRLVDQATRAGITCAVAAGNEGPAQLSVGSPGSAREALTVGGAIDPLHLRVALETLFGLPTGAGSLAYPHELEVVDFSSCGLTADGRVKPGLIATGLFAFSSTLEDFSGDGLPDTPAFGFGAGTSFSTPTVAGAAALCAAFEKSRGRHGHGSRLADALVHGADPIAPFARVSAREQGAGFVRVPAALEILEHGGGHAPQLEPGDPLVRSVSLESGSASAEAPSLAAGETFQVYVEVPPDVGRVHVTFPMVTHSGDENPFIGDALDVAIHSAKRGGTGDYAFRTGAVEPGESFDWEMPEPGTARITFSGSATNYGEVSGSVELSTEPLAIEPDRVFSGILHHEGVVSHTFDVGPGLTALAVRASWEHDWSRFPTYDLDLFLQGPDGVIPVATVDSPEIAWIEAPSEGSWTLVLVDFSTVRGVEPYRIEIAFVGPVIVGEAELPDRARLVSTRSGANGAEEIRFALPRAGRAALDVFDVLGRRVARVAEGEREAGEQSVLWDGRDAGGRAVGSGVYFLRLATDDGVATRKVVRVR